MMVFCKKKIIYFWLAFVCSFLIETAKYHDTIVPQAMYSWCFHFK